MHQVQLMSAGAEDTHVIAHDREAEVDIPRDASGDG